jgi:chemotaxis protein methyltransferase CheR
MTKDLDCLLGKLKQARNIDFSDYRPDLLRRRIEGRLAKLRIDDYACYLEYLENDPSEWDNLIDTIAINVSSFFRDPIVFEVVAQKLLPGIIEKRCQKATKEIRIWSAGCAGGEEPYSLAILLCEALKEEASEWAVHIFGTDIDKEALERAKQAVYSRESLMAAKLGHLDQYFDPTKGGFKLKPEVRKMVRFSNDDLAAMKTFAPTESVFGEFDMIFCRNVLIYFKPELQNRVMKKFMRSLAPEGYLILGDSEKIGAEISAGFGVVDRRNRIYKKRTR